MSLSLSCDLSLSSRSSGGASEVNPMTEFTATLGFWDYTDPASMTAGDGGAVVQGDGDTVALLPDQMGTFDIEQTDPALRPTYNNGVFHSGAANERLQMPLSATKPGNAVLVFIQKGTRGNTDLYVNFADSARVRAQVGSATAVSPPTSVNGVSQATRNDLANAIKTGVANVILIDGVNMSAWSGLNLGGITGAYLTAGHYMLVAMLDKGAADYADALSYATGTEAPRQITALGL